MAGKGPPRNVILIEDSPEPEPYVARAVNSSKTDARQHGRVGDEVDRTNLTGQQNQLSDRISFAQFSASVFTGQPTAPQPLSTGPPPSLHPGMPFIHATQALTKANLAQYGSGMPFSHPRGLSPRQRLFSGAPGQPPLPTAFPPQLRPSSIPNLAQSTFKLPAQNVLAAQSPAVFQGPVQANLPLAFPGQVVPHGNVFTGPPSKYDRITGMFQENKQGSGPVLWRDNSSSAREYIPVTLQENNMNSHFIAGPSTASAVTRPNALPQFLNFSAPPGWTPIYPPTANRNANADSNRSAETTRPPINLYAPPRYETAASARIAEPSSIPGHLFAATGGPNASSSRTTEPTARQPLRNIANLLELEYRVIHLLVNTVQKMLEKNLFDFAKRWIPNLLVMADWQIPEQGELNNWEPFLARNVGDVNFAFRANDINISYMDFRSMLMRLHHLRHAAVHRNPIGTGWLRRWMVDAVDVTNYLTKCLKDPRCYNKFRTIEFGLWQPHKVDLEEIATKPLDAFVNNDEVPDRANFVNGDFMYEVRGSSTNLAPERQMDPRIRARLAPRPLQNQQPPFQPLEGMRSLEHQRGDRGRKRSRSRSPGPEPQNLRRSKRLRAASPSPPRQKKTKTNTKAPKGNNSSAIIDLTEDEEKDGDRLAKTAPTEKTFIDLTEDW
ncbi:uncharacterized protein LY89DRAFT_784174 [Mollisia scopiformis]|uniref:Uncharacterized protein n=1 Tax=Mollisia scopiformis TaxID=149040 RepID=A0A194X1V8_MOLSC|nr:uncharacterized protein LY89DRAFT_784174 [Mollisia scopiformis]KUJ14183.1 hypothetical protein LY89DRAFT_784174 [Mollisia scopiformis]